MGVGSERRAFRRLARGGPPPRYRAGAVGSFPSDRRASSLGPEKVDPIRQRPSRADRPVGVRRCVSARRSRRTRPSSRAARRRGRSSPAFWQRPRSPVGHEHTPPSLAPGRSTGVPQASHGTSQMQTQRDGLRGRLEIKTGRKECHCSLENGLGIARSGRVPASTRRDRGQTGDGVAQPAAGAGDGSDEQQAGAGQSDVVHHGHSSS
jgi:hypothetical protein